MEEFRFLSTLSLRRATVAWLDYSQELLISIHALLAESDVKFNVSGSAISDFYPRSPCGERHKIKIKFLLVPEFLSTLSLRRATTLANNPPFEKFISIHALLAESDQAAQLVEADTGISIHALLAESDWLLTSILTSRKYFYPRSPCGERRGRCVGLPVAGHFYPRSPCGERHSL